jgi:hypothetical protein
MPPKRKPDAPVVPSADAGAPVKQQKQVNTNDANFDFVPAKVLRQPSSMIVEEPKKDVQLKVCSLDIDRFDSLIRRLVTSIRSFSAVPATRRNCSHKSWTRRSVFLPDLIQAYFFLFVISFSDKCDAIDVNSRLLISLFLCCFILLFSLLFIPSFLLSV